MIPEIVFVISMYGVGCDVRPNHPTKSGVLPVVGFTVAADPAVLPLGSIIHVDGFGERMVQDIGPRVRGHSLDLFVSDCGEARDWGRRHRKVRVLHVGGKGGKKR